MEGGSRYCTGDRDQDHPHGKGAVKHCQTLFSGAPKSLQMVNAAMKLKDADSLEEKL